MAEKNYNSMLIQASGQRPLLVNPALITVSGSLTAGVFLSQLLYWHDKGKYGDWVYKTIKEFKEETTLSREQQDRAIKKWKELGVLEVELRQIPAKRFFRVDIDRLVELLSEYYQMDDSL